MKEIIKKWKEWKKCNPESCTYDCVYDFVEFELSRGDLYEILNYIEKNNT